VVARGSATVSFVVQRIAAGTMQSIGSTSSVFGLSSEFASSREDFFFTLLPFFYQAIQAYLTAFHNWFNVRIKSLFLNLVKYQIPNSYKKYRL
jgi:hypothetical protein